MVEVWPEVLSMASIGQILNRCVWPQLFSQSILRMSVVIASEWQRAKELASGLAYPCFIYISRNYPAWGGTFSHNYLFVRVFNVRSCHLRLTLGRAPLWIHKIRTERAQVRQPSSIFEQYKPLTEPQLNPRWTWVCCAVIPWVILRNPSQWQSFCFHLSTFIRLNLTQACSVRPKMLYL